VLHVLYLIFNEGYAASSGESLARVDLSNEAIRLARAVQSLLPQNPEVLGLLALMLLTDARRGARSGSDGEIIPLDEQDRTLWNRETIDEGVALVSRALAQGAVGTYQLQAAIAACHDEAADVDATDWPQILVLYGLLQQMSDNPMLTVNRAVAVAMVHGPQAALALLEPLSQDARVSEHHRLAAVRAYLYERAGDAAAAVAHYQTAADRTSSTPERNHLLLKAARLRDRLS
jgi:predicted RNA polymerase sigma factor